MKRRSFIASSLIGATGITLTTCSGIKTSTTKSSKSQFRIADQAPKPPLGWNSFDSYGVYLHHEAAMKNIKAMAEKLKPHGYEYFVIDGGWYGEFSLEEGTIYPKEKHAANVNFNEYGIYQPSKTYFHQGFKPIVDYAHELGLKIGLHLMRGIPRKAVELNLPVKNTNYRAKDIADVNSICVWNQQNYGIDVSKPGGQEYYDSVYAQVAEWKFDYVKVDDLSAYPEEIVAIADAIEKSGRIMIYSLSPGQAIHMPNLTYYKRANMLRITRDIWDRREDLNKAFEAWKKFQGIANKGFWPDLDMIPFGQLQLMSPGKSSADEKTVALAGLGNTRFSNLTKAQMRTFITIRALAASPLMMGGDLPTLDYYSLELITNREMLDCDQNGECGINIYEKDGIEVWITSQKNNPGKGWLGIFNRNESSKIIELTRENLGFQKYLPGNKLVSNESPYRITDVWKNESFTFDKMIYKSEIAADDVVFMRFEEII